MMDEASEHPAGGRRRRFFLRKHVSEMLVANADVQVKIGIEVGASYERTAGRVAGLGSGRLAGNAPRPWRARGGAQATPRDSESA